MSRRWHLCFRRNCYAPHPKRLMTLRRSDLEAGTGRVTCLIEATGNIQFVVTADLTAGSDVNLLM